MSYASAPTASADLVHAGAAITLLIDDIVNEDVSEGTTVACLAKTAAQCLLGQSPPGRATVA